MDHDYYEILMEKGLRHATTPEEAIDLQNHLASCPDCEAFRRAVVWTATRLGAATPALEVSTQTLVRRARVYENRLAIERVFPIAVYMLLITASLFVSWADGSRATWWLWVFSLPLLAFASVRGWLRRRRWSALMERAPSEYLEALKQHLEKRNRSSSDPLSVWLLTTILWPSAFTVVFLCSPDGFSDRTFRDVAPWLFLLLFSVYDRFYAGPRRERMACDLERGH